MFLDVFIIAVGLAMDAFCVSICAGMTINRINPKVASVFGCYFGGFQFFMPLVGFFGASFAADYVSGYAGFISFGILAFIGGKMFIESFGKDNADPCAEIDYTSRKRLTTFAVATSIDALAVGVTFRLAAYYVSLKDAVYDILWRCAVIGIVAFAFSFVGVYLGKRLGVLFRKNAERVGGLALMGIGVKILLETIM